MKRYVYDPVPLDRLFPAVRGLEPGTIVVVSAKVSERYAYVLPASGQGPAVLVCRKSLVPC